MAEALKANSWQVRLDKALLDIDTAPDKRVRLLQRALQDPNLIRDVRSAVDAVREKGFREGHPDAINTLWPEGTIARRDIVGIAALQKQVPEVVRNFQQEASTVMSTGTRSTSFAAPSFDDVFKVLTNSEKQAELREEAMNVLRTTPKGLETPQYEVVRVIEGAIKLGTPERIEIRRYEPFVVAQTSMKMSGDSGGVFGTTAGGNGFGALAGYLFGRNEEKKSMAMTMPVEISKTADPTSGSTGATMAFVLPRDATGESAPPPTPLPEDGVFLAQVPTRLVAVKQFPGIVTDEEVERQREALVAAFENADNDQEDEVEALSDERFGGGRLRIADPSSVSVLQYNAPYTIPWRRRNEIALIVEKDEEGIKSSGNSVTTTPETSVNEEENSPQTSYQGLLTEQNSPAMTATTDAQEAEEQEEQEEE